MDIKLSLPPKTKRAKAYHFIMEIDRHVMGCSMANIKFTAGEKRGIAEIHISELPEIVIKKYSFAEWSLEEDGKVTFVDCKRI